MTNSATAATCTGLTAFWCPRCGDCTCARPPDGDCCFDAQGCPLHGTASRHAESVSFAEAEERISAIAKEAGVTLTENDQREVARFAQWLMDRKKELDRD